MSDAFMWFVMIPVLVVALVFWAGALITVSWYITKLAKSVWGMDR